MKHPSHPRLLLLSAYDAASHKRWRTQLVAHLPQFEWTILALPPRFFSWRLRGNPLTWAFNHAEDLQGPFDGIIATSMVDLAVLRGLLPHLAAIPTLYYFHENQFAYPVREPAMQREVFHFCMHQLLSALCAEHICFNSAYNRDTCLQGASEMLAKMPDHVPGGLVDRLEARSSVLPVPLEEHCFLTPERCADDVGVPAQRPLQIVWNHRWEYDKAPERLFGAAALLRDEGVSFRLHVVGQQFRSQPPSFAEARESLHDVIGQWGYVEDAEAYRRLLQTSDLAVSTALHDFQGLALLEAVAAGCRPVVPNRLAYPQWIPEEFRYPSQPDDEAAEVRALADHIKALAMSPTPSHDLLARPDLTDLSWSHMKGRYEKAIIATIEGKTQL